ncbi:hypothetical protein CKO44_09345 [Rubrivivax gelatinosus]|uniref:DUF2325 domain-containing protein n=1 Tax=Rubrivivax gelatinosus TaxID=28068 RepID=A0ABS1DS22_RUBGE|nr:DUF2325 domain-containing protein [Rubrivivax gelatinosus]MBK1613673.1 hypothetical protein [Rubrivivax gelatinosus]MBK1712189.1 hypothetical protein [Rubrivivax gelatinosus]
MATPEFELLRHEHLLLLRAHGRAQQRCSQALQAQAREIERLQAQAMRLRAALVVRETALAWAQEDKAALERVVPGLPRRAALARRVDELLARLQDLMRERLTARPLAVAAGSSDVIAARPDDQQALESSLGTADLVICQTGCLSHGAYWLVKDHCRRHGKACLLAERPAALRIVHIRTDEGEAS